MHKSSGGFATVAPDGRRSYELPAEPVRVAVTGRDAKLITPPGSEPVDPH